MYIYIEREVLLVHVCKPQLIIRNQKFKIVFDLNTFFLLCLSLPLSLGSWSVEESNLHPNYRTPRARPAQHFSCHGGCHSSAYLGCQAIWDAPLQEVLAQPHPASLTSYVQQCWSWWVMFAIDFRWGKKNYNKLGFPNVLLFVKDTFE